jgi:tRNA nucleotidyltransferase/poly(A) polymerase
MYKRGTTGTKSSHSKSEQQSDKRNPSHPLPKSHSRSSSRINLYYIQNRTLTTTRANSNPNFAPKKPKSKHLSKASFFGPQRHLTTQTQSTTHPTTNTQLNESVQPDPTLSDRGNDPRDQNSPHNPIQTSPTTLPSETNVSLYLPTQLQQISYTTSHPVPQLVQIDPPFPFSAFPPEAQKVINVFKQVSAELCGEGTEIRIAGGWIRDLLRTHGEYYTDHTMTIAENTFKSLSIRNRINTPTVLIDLEDGKANFTQNEHALPRVKPRNNSTPTTNTLQNYLKLPESTPDSLNALTRSLFSRNFETYFAAQKRSNFTPLENSLENLHFSPTYLEKTGKLGDVDIAINNMTGAQLAEYLSSYCRSQNVPCKIQAVNSDYLISRHLATARGSMFDSVSVDLVNLRTETYVTQSSHRVPTMDFGSPQEDACRRDFTVNSLFYNITTNKIEDWNGGGGLEDLKLGRLRTPLNPMSIFSDDPLRILRVVRFSTRFGFIPSIDLFKAANVPDSMYGLLYKVSRERIGKEVMASFLHSGLTQTDTGSLIFFVQLLTSLNAVQSVFPLQLVQTARLEAQKRQFGVSSRQLRKEHGILKRVTEVFQDGKAGEGKGKGIDGQLGGNDGDNGFGSNEFEQNDGVLTWSPTMTQNLLLFVTSFEHSIISLEKMFVKNHQDYFGKVPNLVLDHKFVQNKQITPSSLPFGVNIRAVLESHLNQAKLELDELNRVSINDVSIGALVTEGLESQQNDKSAQNTDEKSIPSTKSLTKDQLRQRDRLFRQYKKKVTKIEEKISILATQLTPITDSLPQKLDITDVNPEDSSINHMISILSLLGKVNREHLFYLGALLSLHSNSFMYPFQQYTPILHPNHTFTRKQLGYDEFDPVDIGSDFKSEQNENKNGPQNESVLFLDETQDTYESSRMGTSHLLDTAYGPTTINPNPFKQKTPQNDSNSIISPLGSKPPGKITQSHIHPTSIDQNSSYNGHGSGVNTVNDHLFRNIITKRSVPPMIYNNHSPAIHYDSRGMPEPETVQRGEMGADGGLKKGKIMDQSGKNRDESDKKDDKPIQGRRNINKTPKGPLIEPTLNSYAPITSLTTIPLDLSQLYNSFRFTSMFQAAVLPRWFLPTNRSQKFLQNVSPNTSQQDTSPQTPSGLQTSQNSPNSPSNIDQSPSDPNNPSESVDTTQLSPQSRSKPPFRPHSVPFVWIDSRHELTPHYWNHGVHVDVSQQLNGFIGDYFKQQAQLELDDMKTEGERGEKNGMDGKHDQKGNAIDNEPIPVYIYFKPIGLQYPRSLSAHKDAILNSKNNNQGKSHQKHPHSHPPHSLYNDPTEFDFSESPSHTNLYDSLFTPVSPPFTPGSNSVMDPQASQQDGQKPYPYAANTIPLDESISPAELSTNEEYRVSQRLGQFKMFWKQPRIGPPAVVWGCKPQVPFSLESVRLQKAIVDGNDGKGIFSDVIGEKVVDDVGKQNDLNDLIHPVLQTPLYNKYKKYISDPVVVQQGEGSDGNNLGAGRTATKSCRCKLCVVKYNTWHNLPDGKEQYSKEPPLIWSRKIENKPSKNRRRGNFFGKSGLDDKIDDTNGLDGKADDTNDDTNSEVPVQLLEIDTDEKCSIIDTIADHIDICILDQNGNVLFDSQILYNRSIYSDVYQNDVQKTAQNCPKFNSSDPLFNPLDESWKREKRYNIYNRNGYSHSNLSLEQIYRFAGHYVYHSHRFHHAKLNDGGLAMHYLRLGYIRQERQMMFAEEQKQLRLQGDDGVEQDNDFENGQRQAISTESALLSVISDATHDVTSLKDGDDINSVFKSDSTFLKLNNKLKLPPKKRGVTGPGFQGDVEIANRYPMIPASDQSWSLPRLGIKFAFDSSHFVSHGGPEGQKRIISNNGNPAGNPSRVSQLLNEELGTGSKIEKGKKNHNSENLPSNPQSNSIPVKINPIYDFQNLFWIAQHHPQSLPRRLVSKFPQFSSISTVGRNCVLQDDTRAMFDEGLRRENSTVDALMSTLKVGNAFATLVVESFFIKQIAIAISNKNQNKLKQTSGIVSNNGSNIDESDILALNIDPVDSLDVFSGITGQIDVKDDDGIIKAGQNNEMKLYDPSAHMYNPTNILDCAISNIIHIRSALFDTKNNSSKINNTGDRNFHKIQPIPKPTPPKTRQEFSTFSHQSLDHLLFSHQYKLDPLTNEYAPIYNSILTLDSLNLAFPTHSAVPTSSDPISPPSPSQSQTIFNDPTITMPFSPALATLSVLLQAIQSTTLTNSVITSSTLLTNWKNNTTHTSAQILSEQYNASNAIFSRLPTYSAPNIRSIDGTIETKSERGVGDRQVDGDSARSQPRMGRSDQKGTKYNLIYDFTPPAMFQQLLHPTMYTEHDTTTTLCQKAFDNWAQGSTGRSDQKGLENVKDASNSTKTKLNKSSPQWNSTQLPKSSHISNSTENKINARYIEPLLLTLQQFGLMSLTSATQAKAMLELDGQGLRDAVDAVLIHDLRTLSNDGLSLHTPIFDHIPGGLNSSDDIDDGKSVYNGGKMTKKNKMKSNEKNQSQADQTPATSLVPTGANIEIQRRWTRDWSCICGGVLDVALLLKAILPELPKTQITLIIQYLLLKSQHESLSAQLHFINLPE